MKKFLKTDEWSIIEEEFHATRLRASESIFSLGNGRFGQRGFFEETYSSDSLPGSYVAGVSFLDRTKVGWWKNGYLLSTILCSPHFSEHTICFKAFFTLLLMNASLLSDRKSVV